MTKKAARVTRKRQRDRVHRVATWNVRTLAVNGTNGYGRAYCILAEAA